MMLDLVDYLKPVSSDTPCGENQEYNSLYLQMDDLSVSVPASQMGESVIEGRDPDWRQLQKNCISLWKDTRDLRVATYIAVSGLCLDGLIGFNTGLKIIYYIVNEHWDNFWPQLDEADDNDPTERLNILSMISPQPGAYDDPVRFITHFRNMRLVPDKRYTIRDWMIANGELDNPDAKVDLSLINAEMLSSGLTVISQMNEQVQLALQLLTDIANIIDEKTNTSISFTTLQNELKKLKNFYSSFDNSDISENEQIIDENTTQETDFSSSSPNVKKRGGEIPNGPVQTRAEALLLLRKSCEYFQKAEPTSPVPFFINRALRMAEMNFMDLLTEIDPNSIERGRDILGVKTNLQEEDN